MNLYLFSDNDVAARFGIGTYLKEMTHALEGTSIHVHIVHLHSARPEFIIEKSRLFLRQNDRSLLTGQVENWYIPEVRNQNTFDGTIQKVEDYFRNVIYLLRLNIKETTDLVFHFNYNQSQALAKGLKEIFDCKTVTTIHFMKWAFEYQGNLQQLHALKSKPENQMSSIEQLFYTTDAYEGLLYKEVDRVIALSQHMKNLLCNEYRLNPEKICVIPNGLDGASFMPVTDKKNLRGKWKISENESLILFAGRLHSIKGLIFLIRAFRKVLETIPDSRLVVAGSGNSDTYVRESKDICTKITFAGLLDRNELYELYQIADIGVVPSLYEPFGYVAIEMMMHEMPVVATATSGLNEVVDATCGIKVPTIEHPDRVEIDTELLAEKILYLLQHPEERKRLGVNARKRYERFYTSAVMRKNLLNFYSSLYDT